MILREMTRGAPDATPDIQNGASLRESRAFEKEIDQLDLGRFFRVARRQEIPVVDMLAPILRINTYVSGMRERYLDLPEGIVVVARQLIMVSDAIFQGGERAEWLRGRGLIFIADVCCGGFRVGFSWSCGVAHCSRDMCGQLTMRMQLD